MLVQRSSIVAQALIEVRRTDCRRFKMGSGEVWRDCSDVDFRVQGINQEAEFHGLFPEKSGNYRIVGSSVAPGRTNPEPVRSCKVQEGNFQFESHQDLEGTIRFQDNILHAFSLAAGPMKDHFPDIAFLIRKSIQEPEFLEHFLAQENSRGEENNRCDQEQPCCPVHISHSLLKIWLDYNTKTYFCQLLA